MPTSLHKLGLHPQRHLREAAEALLEPMRTLWLLAAAQPNVASAEVVSSWTDFSKSPYLNEQKVIFHPGEVRLGLV